MKTMWCVESIVVSWELSKEEVWVKVKCLRFKRRNLHFRWVLVGPSQLGVESALGMYLSFSLILVLFWVLFLNFDKSIVSLMSCHHAVCLPIEILVFEAWGKNTFVSTSQLSEESIIVFVFSSCEIIWGNASSSLCGRSPTKMRWFNW